MMNNGNNNSDELRSMLEVIMERAKLNARNKQAYESRAGQMDKWSRQGAIAGSIGQGIGTASALAQALAGYGGGEAASPDLMAPKAGGATGYQSGYAYPGDSFIPRR